jgi:hypothetical protein
MAWSKSKMSMSIFRAHRLLDRERVLEKFNRRLVSVDRNGTVQEPGLAGELYGFGFVKGRNSDDVPGSGKRINCGMQVCCTVASV